MDKNQEDPKTLLKGESLKLRYYIENQIGGRLKSASKT
jgi:hypothetical protein